MTLTRLLLLLISSLCFAVTGPAQSQSADAGGEVAKQIRAYMQEGSAFYLQHDFKRAIPPYQKALDLEKKQPTLDKTLWRVLVDNLGMAYGISGDLKKAKETFTYGLEKDPKYPMFHYNMACTYAEMNDVDKTITYLRQAFQYKENMIKGERMPDPWTDDSFQRFMNNDKFVNALKELNRN